MNTRNFSATLTGIAAVTIALTATLRGSAAWAQNRQNDKNNMRNIGLAAGAGALYEAAKGKGTNALILGAGAAYAGKKYEDQRKAENKDAKAAARRHYLATHHRRHHTVSHHG